MSEKSKKAYQGFEVIDAEDTGALSEMRRQIYDLAREIFNLPDVNPDRGLNYFHEHTSKLSDGMLNDRRMKLISRINSQVDCGAIIYSSFKDYLIRNLGPDLLVQKNSNLVLQQPNDKNPSEIHRDAPLNSCYEMVLWVPLVDCFRTKSMYMLNFDQTKKAYDNLNKHGDWGRFETESISVSVNPTVNFGQALAFSSVVLHGSEINSERETRVSLNVRYKNIFSPSGLKNQLQFFKPIAISDFAKVGAELELEVEKSKKSSD
jgi:sporadic carbohydrate cluster 2OG-Fe(II) oxygenase